MGKEEEENPIDYVEANKKELEDLTDEIINMFEILEYACDSRLCKLTHKEMCETTQGMQIESE